MEASRYAHLAARAPSGGLPLGAAKSPIILRTSSDAEELVQEAITKFVEGGSDAWDPERYSPTHAVGSVLNGLIANNKRKRREMLGETENALEVAVKRLRDPRGGEDDHVTRDYARRALQRIGERLEKDPLALAVVSQFEEGIDAPLDEAAALGSTMRDLLAGAPTRGRR